MRNGKYSKSTGFKSMALLLAMVLLVGCAIGGTLAWLTAKTTPVTNTFTTSDINITLAETKTDFKMVPGWTIDKDPEVTVTKGSEDCWLFVKVDESCGVKKTETENYNFDDFIAYAIENGWTAGDGTGEGKNGVPVGVYFRKVEGVTEDKVFEILAAGEFVDTAANNTKVTWSANQVATKPSVTKEMMEAANKVGATKPTLTFTAYASQLYKTNKPATGDVTTAQFTAAQAWANVPKT